MPLDWAVHNAQAVGLSARALTACLTGYTACGQGLPSDFCCKGNSQACKPFNGGRSAVCCPTGSDCSTIQPIACNIQLLNVTAFPASPIHTSDLTGTMQPCGQNACCPMGFDCQSNNVCVLNSTSSSAPISTAPLGFHISFTTDSTGGVYPITAADSLV